MTNAVISMVSNSNYQKIKTGLYTDRENAFYQTKYMLYPVVFDSRFAKGCDRVAIHLLRKPYSNTKGIRLDQEFVQVWPTKLLVYRNGVATNIKRLLMAERGIPDKLVYRIVTKFVDGDFNNMRSDNIVLAEVISVHNHDNQDYIGDTSRYYKADVDVFRTIHKEDLYNVFEKYCMDIGYPVILLVDGIIKAKHNC